MRPKIIAPRTLIGIFLAALGLAAIQGVQAGALLFQNRDLVTRFKSQAVSLRGADIPSRLQWMQAMGMIACFRSSEAGPDGGPMAAVMNDSPCARPGSDRSVIFEVTAREGKMWNVGLELRDSLGVGRIFTLTLGLLRLMLLTALAVLVSRPRRAGSPDAAEFAASLGQAETARELRVPLAALLTLPESPLRQAAERGLRAVLGKLSAAPDLSRPAEIPGAPSPLEERIVRLTLPRDATVVIMDENAPTHERWERHLPRAGLRAIVHLRSPAELAQWFVLHAIDAPTAFLIGETGLAMIEDLGIGPASCYVSARSEETTLRDRCRAQGIGLLALDRLETIEIKVGRVFSINA